MNEWTIAKLMEWTTQHFNSKGIESARLDGELLLSHTLKCKRLDLYLRFDQPVTPPELKIYKEFVLRRSKKEPVAYILGTQEFYKRPFEVSSGVLIPRPETEHLVDEALTWAKTRPEEKLSVLELGCGSGAICVSLAAEEPRLLITALDISKVASDKTLLNAEKNNVKEKITVEQTDFLNWTAEATFDLVISNPPYVGRNTSATLRPDVIDHEPHEALFGGETGSELLKVWIPKMAQHMNPNGLLLCEIGYDQEQLVKTFAEMTLTLEKIEVLKDYSGHPRVLRAFKKGMTTNG